MKLLNTFHKTKNKFAKFVFISSVIVVILSSLNWQSIDTSLLITYYTFTLGFHIQSYISVNLTNKAELLRGTNAYDSIINSYKKVIRISLIGLISSFIVSICDLEFKLKLSVFFENSTKTINILNLFEATLLMYSLYLLIKLVNSLMKFFSYKEPKIKNKH